MLKLMYIPFSLEEYDCRNPIVGVPGDADTQRLQRGKNEFCTVIWGIKTSFVLR
jgi:hypothetical protein